MLNGRNEPLRRTGHPEHRAAPPPSRLKHMLRRASLGVPDTHASIIRGQCNEMPIVRECQGTDPVGVAVELHQEARPLRGGRRRTPCPANQFWRPFPSDQTLFGTKEDDVAWVGVLIVGHGHD